MVKRTKISKINLPNPRNLEFVRVDFQLNNMKFLRHSRYFANRLSLLHSIRKINDENDKSYNLIGQRNMEL